MAAGMQGLRDQGRHQPDMCPRVSHGCTTTVATCILHLSVCNHRLPMAASHKSAACVRQAPAIRVHFLL